MDLNNYLHDTKANPNTIGPEHERGFTGHKKKILCSQAQNSQETKPVKSVSGNFINTYAKSARKRQNLGRECKHENLIARDSTEPTVPAADEKIYTVPAHFNSKL